MDDAETDNPQGSRSDLDLHSALIASPTGRVAAALMLAAFSFWIVAPNAPPSAVRTWADGLWAPADAIGLNQDWGVFSPNPRNQSLDVRARVEFGDGTVGFWDLPEFDPVVGAYRQYRWQKWQERVRLDDSSQLWEPTARWIAERFADEGFAPTRIVLIRRWIDHQPLTIDGRILDAGWNEYEFFAWDVSR